MTAKLIKTTPPIWNGNGFGYSNAEYSVAGRPDIRVWATRSSWYVTVGAERRGFSKFVDAKAYALEQAS